MEDVDKSKVDSVDMSDADATDDAKEQEDKPKKRRGRRRREIDMIRLEDDDDDEDSGGEGGPSPQKKLQKLSSPGPNSPGHAGAREPRSCVLKASQKRKPLSRLLEQLLRNLEKRDPNNFFAWPVNDNFAPGYSTIIKRPMDFCTMKQKIDDNEYRSLNCFINDFKLVCNNAMKYNKSGTVYHKAARRLLHVGLKQLTPAKLRPLGNILTYMYEIPIRELGFDIGKMDEKVLKNYNSNWLKCGEEEGDIQSDSASDSKQEPSGSEDEVKIKMEAAREQHRKRLARKAFPRMDVDGKTTLYMVVEGATPTGDPAERGPTLANHIGKLQQGTGALQSFREDRRNLVKGVKPLDYGPFSSYAPSYDSTFATLTKEESHLLYHTYGSETGQGSEELLRFAADSPWSLIYDMEELFPDKKKEAENISLEDSKPEVKVDLESLRSLSELGIDVDFLQDLEEEIAASQRDYGLSPSLAHTLKLLNKLQAEQNERLSAPLPAHLSLVPRPSASERELARCVASCLRGMIARLPPQHAAPLSSIRKAIGVTLEHLDTPMSLDDFIELEMGVERSDADLKTELK